MSNGLPTVTVPVLSKAIERHVAQRLQSLALAEQNAKFRRAPGSDHDGGGGGEAHGAGAGDDQHATALTSA